MEQLMGEQLENQFVSAALACNIQPIYSNESNVPHEQKTGLITIISVAWFCGSHPVCMSTPNNTYGWLGLITR